MAPGGSLVTRPDRGSRSSRCPRPQPEPASPTPARPRRRQSQRGDRRCTPPEPAARDDAAATALSVHEASSCRGSRVARTPGLSIFGRSGRSPRSREARALRPAAGGVHRRAQRASQGAAQGRPGAGRQSPALPKPSVAAAALNKAAFVRDRPGGRALIQSGRRLREAQEAAVAGKRGADLSKAIEEHRSALDRVQRDLRRRKLSAPRCAGQSGPDAARGLRRPGASAPARTRNAVRRPDGSRASTSIRDSGRPGPGESASRRRSRLRIAPRGQAPRRRASACRPLGPRSPKLERAAHKAEPSGRRPSVLPGHL